MNLYSVAPETFEHPHDAKEKSQTLSDTISQAVAYEHPLSERTRTLLRIEFLFEQARAHTFRHSPWDSRAALQALFSLTDIVSRADPKNELIKELERQTGFLDSLAENPQVNTSRLDKVLNEMDALSDRLHSMQSQTLDIRNNCFLANIKQRSTVAGGCCTFDTPAFNHWLSQPDDTRILNIQNWLKPFDIIHQTTTVLLRVIRDSGEASNEIAADGFYQCTLNPNSASQLLRIELPSGSPYFPEVSGGKHRFTVRFMRHSLTERPQQATENVKFILTCCML